MSWAPFLISLSSSGQRYDSVSRESSVHSMISISDQLLGDDFHEIHDVLRKRMTGKESF